MSTANNVDLELYKCVPGDTIVEAMKKIDLNNKGLLYVVDIDGTLVGCITDGDIRRWIIKGGGLDATAGKAMNTEPVFVSETERGKAAGLMTAKEIYSVAIVDESRKLTDVLFSSTASSDVTNDETLVGTPVVVMAGGKGTRLYPYTKILPKPLIPVGDIPILERILERFTRYGLNEFYLTVNYRKEMIKSYFIEASGNYNIHFVEEDVPLGTAGSIRLIEEKFDRPVIVTNCDILIQADYADVMRHHIESGNDLTIVSSLKNTVIPYGVLHTEKDGVITSMEEKPELSHFINTGMYILNPEYIDWIPEKKTFHMTNLADKLMQNGKRVGMYPISENSFLDMGEFAEMKRMEERINAGFIE